MYSMRDLMSDVSVKPDSQMLVDSIGLVSQVSYKVNMLRVRNFISPEKKEPYHHNSFDGAINLEKSQTQKVGALLEVWTNRLSDVIFTSTVLYCSVGGCYNVSKLFVAVNHWICFLIHRGRKLALM